MGDDYSSSYGRTMGPLGIDPLVVPGAPGSTVGGGSTLGGASSVATGQNSMYNSSQQNSQHRPLGIGASSVAASSTYTATTAASSLKPKSRVRAAPTDGQTPQTQNDEIVISAAMQQLRDPGVLIVAHGSRGKPKTVRLQLTEAAITWRTETRRKTLTGGTGGPPKMGKLHQVPLGHIMYVDVGKQTTALRRVENASVSEALCFSLLTKEGSLDLEANSPRERDALVSCFSLVLDEVHAQNWRDIYRGPSSDMPSSFDDFDNPNTQPGPNQGGRPGNAPNDGDSMTNDEGSV
eukprot:scaffold10201_cov49-Attheya_sp.AAC.1